LLLALALLAGVGVDYGYRLLNPDSLRRIVLGECVPAQRLHGTPGPCREVNLVEHYAVLKDIHGAYRHLLLPTDSLSGIESPQLLSPASPNYWRAAWQARRYLEQRIGHAVERDRLGLSINSSQHRSQNLLHIHIDCVNAGVRHDLTAQADRIGSTWSAKSMTLDGHPYFVMRAVGAELSVDPFKVLAARLHSPADMALESLSVIGARFTDGTVGFYFLDSPSDAGGATTEDTLDRRCAVLRTR
jgi:CDP-diacylglycerol pyrophosphatase